MKHLFAAAFMLCAPVAEAQDLPMRTMVSGVAATDVLNIRSGPGAGFDKVGEIAPFATNVEVLEVRLGLYPLRSRLHGLEPVEAPVEALCLAWEEHA